MIWRVLIRTFGRFQQMPVVLPVTTVSDFLWLQHIKSYIRICQDMLDKCANPSCATLLVYLREGRIFAFPVREEFIEHFWLCGSCSEQLTLRNSERGVQVVPRGKIAKCSVKETQAQFGRVLKQVIQGNTVLITEDDTPKAVLMPLDEFTALSRATEFVPGTVNIDSDSFLIQMQTPGMRTAMKAAFDASPEELGESALAAVRKRE